MLIKLCCGRAFSFCIYNNNVLKEILHFFSVQIQQTTSAVSNEPMMNDDEVLYGEAGKLKVQYYTPAHSTLILYAYLYSLKQ